MKICQAEHGNNEFVLVVKDAATSLSKVMIDPDIDVSIEGVLAKLLVDTGARVTIVLQDKFKEFWASKNLLPPDVSTVAFEGSKIDLIGYFWASLCVFDETIQEKVYVAKKGTNPELCCCRNGSPLVRDREQLVDTRPEASAINSHKLDAVLAAVECTGTALDQTRTSLENKIDKMTSDLNLLHTDHHKLVDKTRLLEDTLSDLAPKTSQMNTSLLELVDRVVALEHRAEDAEGRTRRDNIHVMGLPGGCAIVACREAVSMYYVFHADNHPACRQHVMSHNPNVPPPQP
ncbi:hypothetical protein NDU88_000536 [Pleurodeles waltl]|uniref:Peptidase A2 domain-containing protein n=1 Tax=Pleurodeles waltl TaxID=8319 RepID=A0AAV7MQ32_PLEWA|nr:hypothetical protein NDU88_000536 [Pleurodeles waltl]